MLLNLSNSLSPWYTESQGQGVVYPKWLLSYELFESGHRTQVRAVPCNARCVHRKATCGASPAGKPGQHGLTLCNCSSSERSLILSLISSAIFVQNVQSRIEVHVLFLSISYTQAQTTHVPASQLRTVWGASRALLWTGWYWCNRLLLHVFPISCPNTLFCHQI